MTKPIKKKKVNFEDIRKKFSSATKYKEDDFFDCGETFLEATGVPGPPLGHTSMFLGHSDTGKTTALIKSAVSAQKKGILPVFIITEQKWNFDYAKVLGLECEKTDDTWDGFFLFRVGFNYIEQIFDYINELLDAQDKGDLPYSLLFCIDSVGSIPCELSYRGKGGNMHTARVISEKYGMGIHQRITSSRNVDSEYTNSVLFVNQPWVEMPENGFGQPKIKSKGGNAIYLSSTFVFLFGNQKNSGTYKLKATRNKRDVQFATISKISVLKNHLTGIQYSDGKVVITPHGFISNNDKSIKEYKEKHKTYWDTILGGEGEIKLGEQDGLILED